MAGSFTRFIIRWRVKAVHGPQSTDVCVPLTKKTFQICVDIDILILINPSYASTMNRRDTLKTILVSTGGLISLPAWADGWTAGDLTTHHTSFSIVEQDLLASVVDTIIPAGNSIGAISVGVDKYLQKLIEKCYELPVQENVKKQLMGLEASAQTTFEETFVNCDQSQRQELLIKLSTSDKKEEKDFFNLMKSETIRGFNTSKEVMTTYLNYKIFPGHYYGCVDVKA
jgi:hypothetical protein